MEIIRFIYTFIKPMNKFNGKLSIKFVLLLESFPHHVNMASNTLENIDKKMSELRIKIPVLAKLLSVSKENLYKWEKGHRPANYEDNIKLENFTKGLFDQFISNGKISEDYKYDKAIKIIFPKNPTNDTYENFNKNIAQKQSFIVQEPGFNYANDLIANALNTILIKDKEIAQLKYELAECLQEKSKINDIQKTA